MRNGQILGLIALLAAGALHTSAAQTVYKWVDESGTVQFSDRPPESVEAEEIELAVPSEPVTESAGTQAADPGGDTMPLAGRWQNALPDQTIIMTLEPGGGSRWQVTYQGQNWSDLTGTWETSEDRLTLHNQLGRTDYGLTVLSEDEIRLLDGQLGTAMVFTR